MENFTLMPCAINLSFTFGNSLQGLFLFAHWSIYTTLFPGLVISYTQHVVYHIVSLEDTGILQARIYK